MISRLIDSARIADSSRNIAYVSNTLADGFINDPKFKPDAGSLGDYLMMNEYGGSWWQIPTGKISHYLDSIHMSYPDKAFMISEFGLCEPNFTGGDERRIKDLVYHMAIYESKPYVEGAIYFDLTDYRTHYPGTSENDKYRRRIHGVYDMYGNPKPSMKVLKEMSSPVEILEKRLLNNGKMKITLFCNIGLPQHRVSQYKLYLSKNGFEYDRTAPYPIPDLEPGQKVEIEVLDQYMGGGTVTIVRPNNYVVAEKSF